MLGPWEASRFRRRVRANLQHNFSRLVLGAQGPGPYNGRDVTQVDTSRQRPGRQRSLGCLAPGHRHRDRYPGPRFESLQCHWLTELPYPCPPTPRASDFTDSSAGRARSYKEASAAAIEAGHGAHLSSQTLAYWARQTRVWAGPEPEAAAPRPRACAASRVPGEQAAAARRTGPPASASSLTPLTACPSVQRFGGRPLLPGTHRYQRGRLPAAPPPQARRSRLGLSPPARRRTKAPPTD
ncbi:uncharacterized protein LOC120101785 [Rattus norvegicus]|uniref:uncharacterized protein LOC120101785 n=1 Tax=Rattus norvegicus TaxID=10116 RepID=UPI002FD83397